MIFFIFYTSPFSDYSLFSFIKNFVFRKIVSKIIKWIDIFRLFQNVRFIRTKYLLLIFTNSEHEFQINIQFMVRILTFCNQLLAVHNLGRHFNLRQTITLNPRLWLCPDLNLHYPRSLLFNPWLSAFSFLDTIAVSEDRSMFKTRFLILDFEHNFKWYIKTFIS